MGENFSKGKAALLLFSLVILPLAFVFWIFISPSSSSSEVPPSVNTYSSFSLWGLGIGVILLLFFFIKKGNRK